MGLSRLYIDTHTRRSPGDSAEESAPLVTTEERGCAPIPMSANTRDANKDPFTNVPTPDRDIPGLTDLATLSVGDDIEVDDRATPLTVTRVGHKPVALPNGDTARANVVEAAHDRANAAPRRFFETLNIADGTVIEIVDDTGQPVRVFADAE